MIGIGFDDEKQKGNKTDDNIFGQLWNDISLTPLQVMIIAQNFASSSIRSLRSCTSKFDPLFRLDQGADQSYTYCSPI